ncbi:MAG: O-antigen ligase family protein [Prolixibacteraceae bacterium]|nr:O-antigen ligase family protein [Prolixibacteraceae bacterium]
MKTLVSMFKQLNTIPIIFAFIAIISTFIVGIDISYYPFIKEEYYFVLTSSFLIVLFILILVFSKTRIKFQFNLLDIAVLFNFLYIILRAVFSDNFYFIDPKFQSFLISIIFYFIIRISISGKNDFNNALFVKVLFTGFISLGLFQSLLGILQLLNVLPLSLPDGQSVYGTFYSSGIYSNFLALIFPFALIGSIFFKKGLKFYSIFTCALMLFVIIFSKGRTSWVAVCLSILLIFSLNNYEFLKRKIFTLKRPLKAGLIILLLVVTTITCYGLYNFKKDSADGRLLIWEISLRAFSEKPILGHGFNSYQYAYNEAKSAFFSTGKVNEERMMLTGTTFTAFNEFIQILVEYGIIGLIFFIAVILITLKYILQIETGKIRLLCISLLGTFIVLSSFSYPLRIVTNQFIFYILLAIVASNIKSILLPKEKTILLPIYILICLVVPLLFIGASSIQIFNASVKWKTGHDLLLNKGDSNDIHFYDEASQKLYWNSNFLYNYGCNLLQCKKSDNAILFLEKARLFRNDNLVYMRLAEAYEIKGEYSKALSCYNKASWLIPYLFEPKYRQFIIYKNIGEKDMAEKIAIETVNSNLKIYNKRSVLIKTEMLEYLYSIKRPGI